MTEVEPEKTTAGDRFKDAAIFTGLLMAMPVVLCAAPIVLTYSAIKDKFIRCPACRSKNVELKGHSFRPGTARCLEQPKVRQLRSAPCFSFYQCKDCGAFSKKLFGDPLVHAHQEEVSNMVAART